MTWGMTAVAAATVASGYMGSKAAKSAAGETAGGTRYAADIEKEMFDISRQDLAPFKELGYTALNEIENRLPFFTSQFDDQQLAQYLDPSMEFRRRLGTQSTERLANVGGGAISGNTLRSLMDYGQNLASTEYGAAFNRAQTERGNIYDILGNIAGMGQGAVNTGVNAAQATGTNLANLAVGGAQAGAAGTVGAANAMSGAVQGLGNQYYLSQLMNRSMPVTVPTGGAPNSAYAPQAVQTSIA